MAEQFFIRWKSVVTGPFTNEAVRDMIRDGKVSKHHQVSSDQVTWTSIHGSDEFGGMCRVEVRRVRLTTSGVGASVGSTGTGTSVYDGEFGMDQPPEANDDTPSPEAKRVVKIREDGLLLNEDRWYYVDNGASEGPIFKKQIRSMVDSGAIEFNSPICREGEQTWRKAGEVFPDFWNARSSDEQSPHSMRGQPKRSAYGPYGGFWLRFFAYLIDAFIIQFAVGLVVGFIIGANGAAINASMIIVIQLLIMLISWIYFAGGESGESQATIGKRAMGLIVTDLNGERITFWHASGRYFSKILSSLFFNIGYLMVAFTEKKQGLHDMMAGTLVIRQ